MFGPTFLKAQLRLPPPIAQRLLVGARGMGLLGVESTAQQLAYSTISADLTRHSVDRLGRLMKRWIGGAIGAIAQDALRLSPLLTRTKVSSGAVQDLARRIATVVIHEDGDGGLRTLVRLLEGFALHRVAVAARDRLLETACRQEIDSDHCSEEAYVAQLADRYLAIDTNRSDGFRDWITGRDVLLIAPGSPETSNEPPGERTIVYVKPFAIERSTRYDVAYINQSDVPLFSQLVRDGEISLPSVLCVKGRDTALRSRVALTRFVESRVPMLLNPPNSGTLAVWDILRHRPRSLEVRGMNLYTSRTLYGSRLMSIYQSNAQHYPDWQTYLRSMGARQRALAMGCLAHDCLSDFTSLRVAATIPTTTWSMDWTLQGLLTQSLEQYAELLDQVMSDQGEAVSAELRGWGSNPRPTD